MRILLKIAPWSFHIKYIYFSLGLKQIALRTQSFIKRGVGFKTVSGRILKERILKEKTYYGLKILHDQSKSLKVSFPGMCH